jgi:hypothetical protein
MHTDSQVRAVARKIANYTDKNYRTLSIKELARFLGDTDSVKALDHVAAQHEIIGHMPQDLSSVRHSIYEKVIALAKTQLTPSQYNLVHGSF